MTRSVKGLGNAVYKVEYWNLQTPDVIFQEGPYATKSAAKGRLTTRTSYSSYNAYAGRVLELTGEWVALD